MKQINLDSKFKWLCIFFLVIYTNSLYPWYIWGVNSLFLSFLIALLAILIRNYAPEYYDISGRMDRTSVILFFLLIVWVNRSNLNAIIASMASVIVFLNIAKLKEEYKSIVLRFITKWMAVILTVSLFFFLARIVGIQLPYEVIQKDDFYGQELNYYFFLLDGDGFTFRFKGPFLEPGYLTLGVAPLLFANKYDFKNVYVVLLFISQVFSFSLAGYISLLFGFTMLTATQTSKFSYKLRQITLFLSLGVVLFFSARYYLGADVFDTLILDRLEWDADESTIAGNNRYSSYFENRYESFISSGSILWGEGWDKSLTEYGGGNSGYKVFLFCNGLLGLFLAILLYLNQYNRHRQREVLLFILFIFVLLSQNAYPTMWALLISCMYGSVMLSRKQ